MIETALEDVRWMNKRRQFDRRPEDRDQLDHLHRLVSIHPTIRAETIAKYTGLPIESVQWVLMRNGYRRAG